jgi:hypothetical protein
LVPATTAVDALAAASVAVGVQAASNNAAGIAIAIEFIS